MQYNLADLFELVVDTVPDRVALVCGDRRLTFAQLEERANRAAHILRDAGVKPGDHVGMYLYNGTEYVEASLGAYKIRAVPVNINYRYVEEELRYLFTDADLVAVVYSREFAPRLAAVAPSVPILRTFVQVEDGSGAEPVESAADYETALAASSAARDFGERSGDDLHMIYTGGTTGMPKGVMWRQEDVFFGGLQGGNVGGAPIERPEQIAEIVASREGPTMLPTPPLMHGAGFWSVLIGLLGGGKVVLSPRFQPKAIWSLVEREKVNVVGIVGDAMARPLAEALDDGSHDLSSVIVITSAGAIFSEAVKGELRRHVPNALFVDAYGVTEAGHQGMNVAAPGSTGAARFTVDANTSVLDDNLRPVAPGSGAVGRLARRGRMPIGYYKDETKTAATFVTDADGVRWVIPGDMATVEADGTVTLLGRGSICINSGGEKIYPEEVEAALKAHAAVFDAVVVGVPDERWGERVAAVVQPREGHTVTLEDIDRHCRTHISGYKVPRELHVVSEIVRSPAGKADYRWAKATAMGNAPANVKG